MESLGQGLAMKINRLNLHDAESDKSGNTLFFAIAVALFVVYLMMSTETLSVEQAQSLTSGYDSRLTMYFVSFLVMLLCALTPVPAEIIALSNTLVFSPMEAFMVTWLSALVSANVGYELGRLNCFDPCKSQNSKICRWLSRYGYKGLAIMRLVPVVPFFALNLCGGLFKLNRARYTLITALTIIPAVALLSFFPHLFL